MLLPIQTAIAIELPCRRLLPLDALNVIVRAFMNPEVSGAGLDHCLRHHGVSNLRGAAGQRAGRLRRHVLHTEVKTQDLQRLWAGLRARGHQVSSANAR